MITLRSTRGYTVAEIVVVLAAVTILATILTPLAIKYVRDARIVRAQADVWVLGEAIKRFENDVGRFPMFTAGGSALSDSVANVVRLQGPGAAPLETTVSAWTSATPTDNNCSANCTADTLINQLIANNPNYPTSASPSTPFMWNGPYVERIETDPWGNQYLVNIINAKSNSTNAAFVLSAGPNGLVETSFDTSMTALLVAGGDDILYRIK